MAVVFPVTYMHCIYDWNKNFKWWFWLMMNQRIQYVQTAHKSSTQIIFFVVGLWSVIVAVVWQLGCAIWFWRQREREKDTFLYRKILVQNLTDLFFIERLLCKNLFRQCLKHLWFQIEEIHWRQRERERKILFFIEKF